MKFVGGVAFVLCLGSVAAAQPPPSAATEDRDNVGDTSLPWYLPPAVTRPVIVTPPPKASVIEVELATHSVSGDLAGSIATIGVYYDSGSIRVGGAIGTESLGLTQLVKSTNTTRSLENDSSLLLVSFAVGRNAGKEVARNDQLHIFALYPSLEVSFGFAGEQVEPGVESQGAGVMGIGGISVALTGARIASCSGWFADIRFPVVSTWGAIREFDPSMTGPENDISAGGTAYGLTIEVGHNHWKRAPSAAPK